MVKDDVAVAIAAIFRWLENQVRRAAHEGYQLCKVVTAKITVSLVAGVLVADQAGLQQAVFYSVQVVKGCMGVLRGKKKTAVHGFEILYDAHIDIEASKTSGTKHSPICFI